MAQMRYLCGLLASLRWRVCLILACRPFIGVRKETWRSSTCSDLQVSSSSALVIGCWVEVLPAADSCRMQYSKWAWQGSADPQRLHNLTIWNGWVRFIRGTLLPTPDIPCLTIDKICLFDNNSLQGILTCCCLVRLLRSSFIWPRKSWTDACFGITKFVMPNTHVPRHPRV